MLPPEPDPALILPALKLPVTFAVPLMFAPVSVITIVVLLTAVKFIFPLALGILTLLFPLLIEEEPPPD